MFEVRVRYTFQDFLTLNRLLSQTYRKRRTIAFRLLIGLSGLIFAAVAVMMLVEYGFSLTWLYVLTVGVAFILIAFLSNYINAFQSRRMAVQDIGEIQFVFGEETFATNCIKQASTTPYSALRAFFRYQERYFLCLDQRHAYILPFSGFVAGNREGFERYLEEKTGLRWNVFSDNRKKEYRLNG